MRLIAILLLLASIPVSARAEEQPVQLKAGVGLEKVEANCSVCHSLDYIRMNSPFLKAEQWDAEVAKMMKSYGCPVDEADAKVIKEYLKANYGG
jgi:sulfite dehydrogenase (cytochrome) subunit B